MKNLFALFLTLAVASQAGPISYDFAVNTSSLSGTSGNLDFQFNPGDASSQAATALISLFSTNGIVQPAPVLTGDVTPNNAALPANFTLGNSQNFNDLFQGITFGSFVNFRVTLSGPAIDTPNGSSTSGSAFYFSLYGQDGVTPLLTTDASGAVGAVSINLNGSTTKAAFLNGTAPSAASITPVVGVPEPATASMLAFGGALLALGLRKR
jgi:hypothetical protein